MRDAKRVVVIGGGVIGAACAYYLAKARASVTIVEQGAFGAGCSHGNCGLICPSHVLPLAEPGALGRTLKALFQKSSPFYIKPRLDLALWSWLIRFARRCNAHDQLESARAIHALLQSSRRLYDALQRDENLECEWQTQGLLFVLRTEAGMERYARTVALQREHFGMVADRYDGDAVATLEPALKPGLAGGWLYHDDAHLRPDRLLASWRAVLENLGVGIRVHCEARHFVGAKDRATAIGTSNGDITGDAFIIAAGALTPRFQMELGCRIPIQPGKGYSITMPRPSNCPVVPLIFEEHHVAVTPMRSGYRLGSTMEFAGYDKTLNHRRLNLLREGAQLYLREPWAEPVQEEWFGWRPMTYDSKPIIGRSPAFANVLIAAGHNMLGISMAPATGKLVAELIVGETPHLDTGPYAATRF